MRSDAPYRRGFTLVELLVVIAIIGILVSLLLPAVQQVRESARRVQCQNNLRQNILGLTNYEQTMNRLPSGCRRHLSGTGFSWLVDILPYLEQDNLYASLDKTAPNHGVSFQCPANGALVDGLVIKVFRCPSSDVPANRADFLKRLIQLPSYAGNSGATSEAGELFESRLSPCCNPAKKGEISGGGVLIPNDGLPLASITDGLSNVIFVAEISAMATDATGKKRNIDAGSNFGFLAGTGTAGVPPFYGAGANSISPCYNVTTIRYAPNTLDFNRDGISDNTGPNNPLASKHPGGVLAAMGDCSVRFLSDDIAIGTLKKLATRDDGLVTE